MDLSAPKALMARHFGRPQKPADAAMDQADPALPETLSRAEGFLQAPAGLKLRVKDAASYAARRPGRAISLTFTSNRQAMVLVGIAWVAALGVLYMANGAIKAARGTNFDVAVAAQKVPPVPSIVFADAPPDRLRAVAEATRVLLGANSAVRVDVNAQGRLIVSSEHIRNYKLWTLAVRAVENTGDRLRWQISDMCVGTGCAGSPLRVELTARTATIR